MEKKRIICSICGTIKFCSIYKSDVNYLYFWKLKLKLTCWPPLIDSPITVFGAKIQFRPTLILKIYYLLRLPLIQFVFVPCDFFMILWKVPNNLISQLGVDCRLRCQYVESSCQLNIMKILILMILGTCTLGFPLSLRSGLRNVVPMYGPGVQNHPDFQDQLKETYVFHY